MSAVIINPGTGPVSRALLCNAWKNIRAFRRAIGMQVQIKRVPRDDDRKGRYAFRLVLERQGRRTRRVLVDMPGLLHVPSESITDFPRLYIDGSSWAWLYALDSARQALGLPEKDEAHQPGRLW